MAKPHWRSTDGSELPGWLQRESTVHHSVFGRGRVVEIGEYKEHPAIVVEFDSAGRKLLSQEFGIPQLSRHRVGGFLKRLALLRRPEAWSRE